MKLRGVFIVGCLLFFVVQAITQRGYATHSVLASGNWYTLAIRQEGVYKVDVSMLATLGINTANLASSSIRLYGNGGGIPDENNLSPRADDLIENAIDVSDGGDGIFNGNDYFSFYTPGPHRWEKDSVNQSFHHRKNLYTDTVFYYLTISGSGKRISLQPITPAPSVTVTSYNERYFYENDLVNFLNSGKEWYGEEFNNHPGGNSTRSFTVDWPGLDLSQPLNLVTDLAGRNVGAAGNFTVKVNGQQVQLVNLPGVSGNFLDAFATSSTQKNVFLAGQSGLSIAFNYNSSANGAQGWLNWFDILGRRKLAITAGNQLFFATGHL